MDSKAFDVYNQQWARVFLKSKSMAHHDALTNDDISLGFKAIKP